MQGKHFMLPEGTLLPACEGSYLPFPEKPRCISCLPSLYTGPSRGEREGLTLPFPSGLHG